jgi:hypothetical protein
MMWRVMILRLAAHDARHGQPLDRADRDEDQEDVAAEHDHEQDHEEHERQRIHDVDEAHHQVVDAAAEIAGDRSPGDADHEAHRGREDADQE